MGAQDAPSVDPLDTTRLRKLLDPVMRRNEKHTLLARGPAEDAFLHALITEGIVPIIDDFAAFAGPYQAAREAAIVAAAAGTTPDLSAPGEPTAVARIYTRPNELAALSTEQFLQEVHLLPVDELERLAAVPEPGDLDLFDAEQRHVLDDVLGGKRQSNVFEIQWDGETKTGEQMEYEGRQVVVLGLADEPDRCRVAYIDADARRDETVDGSETKTG